ncbi:hypothetical protein F511_34666 [Dorcoceras hygrometricum]|uniref:Uncharacterized protein n=1 Tax=Dorcoceras hygrometricum TaxID=472368 RepID=A0A2Z7AM82_9LAMI|nr:hypothetical protein F511_34666 [Dorcoceras hygrometricum]
MESAVMTSALMSSQSAVGYQQMKRSERDEATSCWRISRWISIDDVIGDIIIFSRWISVDDVIGDVIIFSRWFESRSRKNQQVACSSRRKKKRRRRGDIQSQAAVHQQMLFGDSDSKTMSFT